MSFPYDLSRVVFVRADSVATDETKTKRTALAQTQKTTVLMRIVEFFVGRVFKFIEVRVSLHPSLSLIVKMFHVPIDYRCEDRMRLMHLRNTAFVA
jgi:hypothetical protein